MAPTKDIDSREASVSEAGIVIRKPKKERSKDKSTPKSMDKLSDELKSEKKDKSRREPKSEKKEKSSKKRKAEALTEPLVPTSIPSPETASALLDSDVSMRDDKPAVEASDNPPTKKHKGVLEDEIEVDITLPEPPSKKELRRLKKGKSVPAKKSGAQSVPDPEAKNVKAEVEKRSEHGVWIGNLPFHVSKEDLRKFFVDKSDDITEEMITRIHMPGPNDKKSANKVEERRNGKTVHNTGFAYVDFSTAEGATEAVVMSEKLLGGRRVLIKNNKSFEGRPQKTKEESRADAKPPSKRVFVGNLPFDATNESIQTHYETCGTIINVKLATFEDTGKCKGYGWVNFEDLEGAKSAVKGFVLVEEELLDESESESEESGSDVEKMNIVKSKPKKAIKKKVWCNRINGRALRTEFAEDEQTRYKKRYGKDGTKARAGGSGAIEKPAEEANSGVIIPKAVEYRSEYAPRLTGGIVESKGKKVTF